MTRTKALIVVILVVILGFLLGWWLSGSIAPAPQTPVQGGATSSYPHVTDGFCCITPGQACIAVSTPGSCFSQHGKGFNSRQPTCDHFCVTIGSIKY